MHFRLSSALGSAASAVSGSSSAYLAFKKERFSEEGFGWSEVGAQ